MPAIIQAFTPPRAAVAPSVESVGAGSTGTGTAKTLSWSHTIGGNAVILGVHHGDQSSTTSIAKVGTTSMTLLQSYQYYTTGSNHFYIDFFGLLSPPTGAQTMSTTISAATDFVAANSISLNNATSFGTPQTTSSSGTALSHTVTAAVNQLIIHMFGNGASSTMGTMSGYNQTQDYYAAGTTSTNYGTLIGHAAGAASVTFSATGTNIQWGSIAVPVS